jgi:D-arabinose 1-dehydrogenase-like Zn-dependent alcohol dehydrogenase
LTKLAAESPPGDRAGVGWRGLPKKLGAHHYIDSDNARAAEQLKKLGGASVILATAPSSKAMSEIFHGLGRNGSLLVVGADMAAIEIPGVALINGRERVRGWASRTASDSEDTLRFAALTGVRPIIEKFPLEKAAEAYARMLTRPRPIPGRADDVNLRVYCSLNCTSTVRCMGTGWPFNVAG